MSMNQKLARVLRTQGGVQWLEASMREQPRQFESARISVQDRYEDHPAPTEDDMISKYYYSQDVQII
jgi:hypothetical protein